MNTEGGLNEGKLSEKESVVPFWSLFGPRSTFSHKNEGVLKPKKSDFRLKKLFIFNILGDWCPGEDSNFHFHTETST